MAKSENPKSNLAPYGNSSAKVHPSNDPEIDPNSYSLEKFRLYETRQVSQSYYFDLFHLLLDSQVYVWLIRKWFKTEKEFVSFSLKVGYVKSSSI